MKNIPLQELIKLVSETTVERWANAAYKAHCKRKERYAKQDAPKKPVVRLEPTTEVVPVPQDVKLFLRGISEPQLKNIKRHALANSSRISLTNKLK